MGLRCLIGHDFSDIQTEQDRLERGREVVVTVREYRECTRCGTRRIVSENKEVTADTTAEQPPDETEESDTSDGIDGLHDEVSAEEDDGIILEDDPDEPAPRQHGEWPDATAEINEFDGEPRDWPEVAGEDEGFDAEPDDGTPVDEVDFKGGLTPERTLDPEQALDDIDTTTYRSPTNDEEPTEVNADHPDESPLGITRASPSPSPTGQQRMADVESEFVCPECGYTAEGVGSSLRPGDICPECRRGYLAEQER